MENINEIKTIVEEIIKENKLIKTEIQDQMLTNHLKEMIKRNAIKEKVPEIDSELFAQVNSNSIVFAERIVNKFENLGKDEIFLLAIHFENMLGEY